MTVHKLNDFIAVKRLPISIDKNAAHISDYTLAAIKGLVPISSPLHKRKTRYAKRAFDIALSIFLILTLLPWMIPIFGILIKLNSRGPIFFVQKRNKQNGVVFNCIKFRTMVVNQDADLRSTVENDERITSFGRFLRYSHLDEIPQLINVVIGDMSLIGPRPHMIIENIYFQNMIKEYVFRNEVKPGITGLSQSSGYFGYSEDIELIKQRLFLDLLYIKKWSLRIELKIIQKTIWGMLTKLRKHAIKDSANHFKSATA
jgi:putative colanic acid biosysnthesis UDP-glucose lipid carrier transferase